MVRAAGEVGRGDAADGRGAAQKTSGGHEREVPVGFQWGGTAASADGCRLEMCAGRRRNRLLIAFDCQNAMNDNAV